MFDINKLKPQTVHVITKQKPYISIRVNMSSWYQERIDISNINISMGYILRNVATRHAAFRIKNGRHFSMKNLDFRIRKSNRFFLK